MRQDRPRLGSALARADRYLSLAGLAAVLLAGVAVAMATRRYVERHLDTAALLRCFGASQRELVWIFVLQLLWLALAASLLGAVLGLAGQAALLALLGAVMPIELPPPGILPLGMGIFTALAVLMASPGRPCCGCAASAPEGAAPGTRPLPASAWWVVTVAAGVFGGLLWLYSGDGVLALGLLVGGLAALLALWGLGGVLLALLARLCAHLPRQAAPHDGLWRALRLGGQQLARRRTASLGQLLAFATALFAMGMIALVRGDLLDTWRAQLPEDTPNHFAINIQPAERDAFEAALAGTADARSALYPMVRGRITAIDGQPPLEAVPEQARGDNVLRRELNLTWRADLRPAIGWWPATGSRRRHQRQKAGWEPLPPTLSHRSRWRAGWPSAWG